VDVHGVTTLVTDSFFETVGGRDDVLLLMHSPGCHGCKHFSPIYDAWAAGLAVEAQLEGGGKGRGRERERGGAGAGAGAAVGLVVARIDGSKNDCPLAACSWNTFPSVFFFRGNRRYPRASGRAVGGAGAGGGGAGAGAGAAPLAPLVVQARDVEGLSALLQRHRTPALAAVVRGRAGVVEAGVRAEGAEEEPGTGGEL
jgi:hypothetical protein